MAPTLTDEQLRQMYDAQELQPRLSDEQLSVLYSMQEPETGGPFSYFARGPGREIPIRQAVLGPLTTVGNALTFNAFDDIVAGGNAAIGALLGEDPRQTYDSTLTELQGYQQDLAERSPETAIGLGVAGALKLPISSQVGSKQGLLAKSAQAGKEGAVLGALYGAGEGDVLPALPGSTGLGYTPQEQVQARADIADRAVKGGMLGGAVSGGLQFAGGAARRGFNYLADGVSDAAKASKVRAFGVTQAKMRQQLKRTGHEISEEFDDLADDALEDVVTDVEIANPYIEAIDDFRAEGGTAEGMRGKKLQAELARQSKSYARELNNELKRAQNYDEVIIPRWDFTEEYLGTAAAGVEKKQAEAIARKAIRETVDNTDGTILSLQKEKQRLGKLIKDGAWGEDTTGQLTQKVYKRIYGDLRRTIEEAYEQATGNPAEVISQLNRKIGLRSTLKPLVDDAIAAGEVADPINWLLRHMKTTGGFGMATLATGATLGPAAALIPLGGGYLLTPSGRLATADALESGLGKLARGSFRSMELLGKGVEQIPTRAIAGVAQSSAGRGVTGNDPTGLGRAFSVPDAQAQTEFSQKSSLSATPSNLEIIRSTARARPNQGAGVLDSIIGNLRGGQAPQAAPQRASFQLPMGGQDVAADRISNAGLDLIKQHEGLRLKSYKDVGGVKTIGYGHTGSGASKSKITEQEAEQLLVQDVQDAEQTVADLVNVPLEQNQFDALVSLVFNIGAGAFKNSTLLKKLNAGDVDGATKEFLRWNKVKGKVVSGLTNRRRQEAQLFSSGGAQLV